MTRPMNLAAGLVFIAGLMAIEHPGEAAAQPREKPVSHHDCKQQEERLTRLLKKRKLASNTSIADWNRVGDLVREAAESKELASLLRCLEKGGRD